MLRVNLEKKSNKTGYGVKMDIGYRLSRDIIRLVIETRQALMQF